MPKNAHSIPTHLNRLNRKPPKHRINNRSSNSNILSVRPSSAVPKVKLQNMRVIRIKTITTHRYHKGPADTVPRPIANKQ
mmetsp:Transcript_31374/g.79571  ORF Transcript_31374/g.79571 Transcript_31374/m.79571 type:complete len:80 (+) Transcript_31374:1393-1632(+)